MICAFEVNENNNKLKPVKNKKEDLDFTILEEKKALMHSILNHNIDFNLIKHLGLRQLTQKLLERNPNKRLSALEAFEELNNIKKGGNLYISKTMKEYPIKLKKIPSVFEADLEKNLSNKNSNKFKHHFINRNETMNNLNKNNKEDNYNNSNDDCNDMTSELSDIKNISKDNNIFNYKYNKEIKIIIKKKK